MEKSNWMARISAGILLITAVLKIGDSFQRHFFFQEADSVIPFFTNRQLMIIASLLEIAVALCLWFSNSSKLRGLSLFWFVCIVITYRIGRYFTQATLPCSCLGFLGRWLKLTWRQIDFLTGILVLFFLITVLAELFFQKSGDKLAMLADGQN